MNWKKTVLICVVILLAGGALTAIIFSTEPSATRVAATQETAMLVDVAEAERGTYRPVIEVMGTVEAEQDITLRPRVSGEIISRSPNYTPGGYVEEGETLLQIDPADYEHTLRQRESELRQAMAQLNIEMGNQAVAQREFEVLGDTLSEFNRTLVLREPQLEQVKADVEAAEAAVEQAKRELERTNIKAPFDAHVISREVNTGSQVSPGDNLGRLVGMESYWVEATVPMSKLRRLTFPGNNQEQGPEVRIRNRTAWGDDEYREGSLYKQLGALEEETRMARVLISVPDPLAHQSENQGLPPLIIDSFVEVRIQGDELRDVIRIDRDYLRQDDTVWVMEDEELQIRDVDIVFSDEEYAYIANGLNDRDQVVTTNLTTVTDGAPLRLEGSENDSSSDPEINNDQ